MEHRNINTVGTIFNDFLGLYTGERPVGIQELIQKYDRHPVLMGLLSNVDSIIYVDVKKAMYEIYPLYKKYRKTSKTWNGFLVSFFVVKNSESRQREQIQKEGEEG